MLPPSVDSAEDFDWQELFGESPTYAALPMSYPPEQFTFPPSPHYTDKNSPVQASLHFDDYPSIAPPVPMSVSQPMAVHSPSTDGAIGYPSPTTSNSSYAPSPAPEIKVELPANIPPRRRGPGRPSKAQLAAEGIHGKRGRSSITLRREIHNDSAMRSRARFNTVLDQLWAVLPEKERAEIPNSDMSRTVCRAEKIEIVIAYIRKLQDEVERRNLY